MKNSFFLPVFFLMLLFPLIVQAANVETATGSDTIPPTVVCSGLSVNIMQTGRVTLWPTDFLRSATDDVTPAGDLQIGLSTGEPAPAIFPRDAAGKPITTLTFDCSKMGPNMVQVWAEDRAGNASYCQAILLVQDNMSNCPSPTGPIVIYPTRTNSCRDVRFQLYAPHPFPPAGLFTDSIISNFTGDSAIVQDVSYPISGSLSITPTQNDNPLNGITTLDLLSINQHILGTRPLGSPYKMIAADANKSGTITALDIAVLRRLILGIDQDIHNNTSWRFVDKNYIFPDPGNPFIQKFPEMVTVTNLLRDSARIKFIAIKVGDVNGNAILCGGKSSGLDDRSTALIQVQDRAVQPGERLSVVFESQEALLAQQFTLEHPGLELLSVEPLSPGMGTEHFGLFAKRQSLTHAWNSDDGSSAKARFRVHFRAQQAGRLSDFLRLSDDITPALAYQQAETAQKPDLAFLPVVADLNTLTVLQTSPNPFSENATIQFYLPEAAPVSLRITDANGRLLREQHRTGEKGLQNWHIPGDGLPAGVLFCTLMSSKSTVVVKITRL
jgi:hypothetical protein